MGLVFFGPSITVIDKRYLQYMTSLATWSPYHSTTLGAFLLREKQLNLKAKRPSAALVRSDYIIERLNVGIHCLAANVQNLAATATYRYRPLIPRGSSPIRCDDGRAGKIPAARKVVVHKRLHQELVNVLSAVLTSDGSNIGDQNTH